MLQNRPERLRFPQLLLFCLITLALVPSTVRGSVSFESRMGPVGSSGWTRVTLPLSRGEHTVLFADLGVLRSGDPASQASVGIGFRRHQTHDDLIAGGYAFFDRGVTATGHVWDRLTLGYELIGQAYDLHINAYLPERTRKLLTSHPADAILLSDTELLFEEANINTYEQAPAGFDIELGRHIAGTTSPTRAFLGAYSYHAPNLPHLQGLRMGVEAAAQLNLPGLPASTLTTKIEGQHDAVRGTHGYVAFELRFPFGAGTTQAATPQATSGMLGAVRKEPGIITQITTPQREIVQTTDALHPITHEPIERVWVVTADGTGAGTMESPACIDHVKSNADSHHLILILGDAGTVDTGVGGFVMQPGQIVAGAGSPLVFLSGSGREAHITFEGSPGSLTNTEIGHPTLTLADHATVVGLTFEGGDSAAIYGSGINGIVRVRGNTVIDTGGAAIDLTAGTDIDSPLHLVIEENTITNAGGQGIRVLTPTGAAPGSVEVAHNTIDGTQGEGVYVAMVHTDLGTLRITHNRITGTGASGIHTLADLGSRLESLHIEGNAIAYTTAGSGVQVSALRGALVKGYLARNTIEDAKPRGIYFNLDVGHVEALVEENVVIRPYYEGISTDSYESTVDIEIRDNQIEDEWWFWSAWP